MKDVINPQGLIFKINFKEIDYSKWTYSKKRFLSIILDYTHY